MSVAYAFEVRHASKSFPGVKALKDVSLGMSDGSIHALLGENGAGKSTLIKIITGILKPDGGSIYRNGVQIHFNGPRAAIAAGIGVVHQERNLIPRFSVAENMSLEHNNRSLFKPLNDKSMCKEAEKWLHLLNVDVDPKAKVESLSIAKMQMVEIAKALSLQSRVLLLDEPTASLTTHEAQDLFKVLHMLKHGGVSMLFVSHKLEEVQEICDTVTVLRDGINACLNHSMEGMERQDLVQMMIGRTELISDWKPREFASAKKALELKNFSTQPGHQDINLLVHRGEIVGLYGLVGAGRTELAKCIIGRYAVTGGSMEVEGKIANIKSVSDAIHHYGIGYISEDRKHEGLVLMHSVLENAGIPLWRVIARQFWFVTDRAVTHLVEPFIRKLEVKTPTLRQLVGNLSGGNQQKISVAKWLAAGAKILIIDEPSVGIDIKTKAYLHQLIRDLSDTGVAILLITSDMPEIISLADRVVVMGEYRKRGEVINNRNYSDMSASIMNLIFHHKAQ